MSLVLTVRYCRLACAALSLCLAACTPASIPATQTEAATAVAALPGEPPLPGAAQLERYLPLLQGKRVGMLVNQTSTIGQQHLVDVLLEQQVNIVSIFAPEHGFRGNYDAGAVVSNSVDSRSGLPLWSLYGANKAPSAEQMQQLDLVIFDIQDVGVRYYTYISSMHYLLEAAATHQVEVLILDRPNPNGRYIDGPVLDPAFRSFVGMHPIPLLHGMTVAELALMIKGEAWITNAEQLLLTVIPVAHYQRQQPYSLSIAPSPNLPNDQAIALYPSLGFFEATPLSVGRGTPFAFQVLGYDQFSLGDFSFTPVSTPGAALTPPLQDKRVTGEDLRQQQAGGLDLSYLIRWQQLFKQQQQPLFTSPQFMDRLAGTDQLRLQIEQGWSEQQIRDSWQQALQQFKLQRQPYLLYP
ncbi:exo-beta-N-acetylmuramidase NamZ family protein [Arsukibacterium sp.]|uniref:exo-beta-N-acetylmuramidase NamZ family protein n=1 Tax=Arsukibacterium sp. TaxID=1977258 RepID=UPI002FD9E35E